MPAFYPSVTGLSFVQPPKIHSKKYFMQHNNEDLARAGNNEIDKRYTTLPLAAKHLVLKILPF